MGSASLSPFEQSQEELTIIMEGRDGKLSKASPPKKCRPTLEIPQITLPHPPIITAHEIFEKIFEKSLEKNKHQLSNLKSVTEFAGKKAPNKFLIYRKIFVAELHRQNIHHSMTDISGYIAKRWNSEPKIVQEEYSRIATEVDNLRKRRFGTDSRKKSRRVKTFSAPVNNVNSAYPISNEIYGNVGNVQEQLDPSNCIFPYSYNITNSIPPQHITQHMYPQAPLYIPQSLYYGDFKDFKPEPNYVNNLSDGYSASVVETV